MFRYAIALPMHFGSQVPTITHDDPQDLPLHANITIKLLKDFQFNGPGGAQMQMSAGTQITGTIIGKQVLPQGGGPAKP